MANHSNCVQITHNTLRLTSNEFVQRLIWDNLLWKIHVTVLCVEKKKHNQITVKMLINAHTNWWLRFSIASCADCLHFIDIVSEHIGWYLHQLSQVVRGSRKGYTNWFQSQYPTCVVHYSQMCHWIPFLQQCKYFIQAEIQSMHCMKNDFFFVINDYCGAYVFVYATGLYTL